jgi:micrococcal nuclease
MSVLTRVLAGLLATACTLSATGETCPADRVDAYATIAYVIDGDTVKLTDGTNVRIVGIDTPEIGRDGRPSAPFAEEARRALIDLLASSPQVGLRYGKERRDRHGRALAHLFLAGGTNAGRRLLEAGLATALVVPPNLWQLECYAAAEERARMQQRGVWRLAAYQPVDAAQLPPGARGFRIVRGTVRRVGESQASIWLNLTSGLALRILKDDVTYFEDYSPRELRGRQVEARGWLWRRHGELRMGVRHPVALRVLD